MQNLDTNRRKFVKDMLVGGTLGALVSAGLLTPHQLLASWPQAAFDADDPDAVLRILFSSGSLEESDRVNLKVPAIAENGAVVPLRIETDLDHVQSISIIVANNPFPLAAIFEMTPRTLPVVSTRIKMGETSQVLAVVKTEGQLYSAQQQVKVTIGGCGE